MKYYTELSDQIGNASHWSEKQHDISKILEAGKGTNGFSEMGIKIKMDEIVISLQDMDYDDAEKIALHIYKTYQDKYIESLKDLKVLIDEYLFQNEQVEK